METYPTLEPSMEDMYDCICDFTDEDVKELVEVYKIQPTNEHLMFSLFYCKNFETINYLSSQLGRENVTEDNLESVKEAHLLSSIANKDAGSIKWYISGSGWDFIFCPLLEDIITVLADSVIDEDLTQKCDEYMAVNHILERELDRLPEDGDIQWLKTLVEHIGVQLNIESLLASLGSDTFTDVAKYIASKLDYVITSSSPAVEMDLILANIKPDFTYSILRQYIISYPEEIYTSPHFKDILKVVEETQHDVHNLVDYLIDVLDMTQIIQIQDPDIREYLRKLDIAQDKQQVLYWVIKANLLHLVIPLVEDNVILRNSFWEFPVDNCSMDFYTQYIKTRYIKACNENNIQEIQTLVSAPSTHLLFPESVMQIVGKYGRLEIIRLFVEYKFPNIHTAEQFAHIYSQTEVINYFNSLRPRVNGIEDQCNICIADKNEWMKCLTCSNMVCVDCFNQLVAPKCPFCRNIYNFI